MRKTKILWTLQSWNPVTGCSKASAGCDNCYAADMARRLKAIDMPRRFLSMEPLIGDLGNIEDLLEEIAWVIVGGESGNRARDEGSMGFRSHEPMRQAWYSFLFQTMGSMEGW